jgi:3-oxoadipate enol-lactonase
MIRRAIEVAGRRLSWLQSGEGSPLVLLHAFPLNAEMWQPQHDNVANGWQLITPDLRGFGESTGPPATSLDDHADDILALFRHLGIERAAIGGLSMGGYIAFALHRRAAQRFRALVLADTRAEADTEEARTNRVKLQQTAREGGPAAVADAMIPKLLGQASSANPQIVERVRALVLAARTEGIVDALDALKTRPDSTPTLQTIGCPTLILVGADDGLTPVAASETMQRAMPRAILAIVPESGHLSNLEQPRAFDTALNAFLASVRNASATITP